MSEPKNNYLKQSEQPTEAELIAEMIRVLDEVNANLQETQEALDELATNIKHNNNIQDEEIEIYY